MSPPAPHVRHHCFSPKGLGTHDSPLWMFFTLSCSELSLKPGKFPLWFVLSLHYSLSILQDSVSCSVCPEHLKTGSKHLQEAARLCRTNHSIRTKLLPRKIPAWCFRLNTVLSERTQFDFKQNKTKNAAFLPVPSSQACPVRPHMDLLVGHRPTFGCPGS